MVSFREDVSVLFQYLINNLTRVFRQYSLYYPGKWGKRLSKPNSKRIVVTVVLNLAAWVSLLCTIFDLDLVFGFNSHLIDRLHQIDGNYKRASVYFGPAGILWTDRLPNQITMGSMISVYKGLHLWRVKTAHSLVLLVYILRIHTISKMWAANWTVTLTI